MVFGKERGAACSVIGMPSGALLSDLGPPVRRCCLHRHPASPQFPAEVCPQQLRQLQQTDIRSTLGQREGASRQEQHDVFGSLMFSPEPGRRWPGRRGRAQEPVSVLQSWGSAVSWGRGRLPTPLLGVFPLTSSWRGLFRWAWWWSSGVEEHQWLLSVPRPWSGHWTVARELGSQRARSFPLESHGGRHCFRSQ